ncbi:hypothetical protein Aduo_008158 [Ancylostoma duodenale]
MRVALIILLLSVCVSAGVFSGLGDKIKNIFGGEGSLAEKLKARFKKLFNNTSVLKIRQKFIDMKNKIKKTLELSAQMKASLEQRLKKLRPIKHVQVKEEGDTIEEINQKSNIGEYLFQSDIVLTQQQFEEIEEDVKEELSEGNRTKRQAFRDGRYPKTIWSDGVNYYFDYSASNKVRSVFKKGAKEWEKDTCINMREDAGAQDKIRVFAENGCWSYVGRLGGKQDLSLGRGCESVGTAAHELGHALGFYHTMSRHDRDNFITLNTHNVKPDWLDQFTKQTPQTNENYGITYDYGSIMHYGGTSASYNKKPTMVPFDTNHQETLGSPFVSFYDLLMLNTHYNCLDKCKGVATPCEMGGIPHPRDCSRCLCPGGYSGKLCNERPPDCGQVLTATTKYQELQKTLGNPQLPENEEFEKCTYWIEAPAGATVEVKIENIRGKYVAIDGCPIHGVEIKSQLDQKATGYRFCAKEDSGVTLTSHSNRVPVIIYSREGQSIFALKYRYLSNGKPGPTPQPKATTAAPVRPQPAVTTRAPRPPVVVTSAPLPGTNGGNDFGGIGGFGDFDGFGGFDKFFCRDSLGCQTLKGQDFCTSPRFSAHMRKAMCPKMCGYCK